MTIEELKKKIADTREQIPKWKNYHYAKVLKMNLESLERTMKSQEEDEKYRKDNPDEFGG